MKSNIKIISNNKAAFHDYEILSKLETGIVLSGSEVKVCRENLGVQLKGSYVIIQKGELFLIGSNFSQYKGAAGYFSHKMVHERKLLVHKRELLKLSQQVKEKGLSIIPLQLYFKGNLIKLEIGIGRGKKKFDKREILKEKQIMREISRKI